jgi:hypothetical protein
MNWIRAIPVRLIIVILTGVNTRVVAVKEVDPVVTLLQTANRVRT